MSLLINSKNQKRVLAYWYKDAMLVLLYDGS